jgi:hypothetical protein
MTTASTRARAPSPGQLVPIGVGSMLDGLLIGITKATRSPKAHRATSALGVGQAEPAAE